MSELWMHKERLLTRLTGRRPRLRTQGCAALRGEQLEGGYIGISSPDLPGFRYMLKPDIAEDIPKIIEALEPALDAFLGAYMAAQDHEDMQKKLTANITKADLGRHGGPMSLVAELT